MKIAILMLLLLPTIACGGNVASVSDDLDLGLGGEWRIELTEPLSTDAVCEIVFAKDYNSCMKRADAKNTADHNRCDKSKAGETCHDKADKQYEDNRASCERVAHSDNLRETGVSYSGGGKYKPQGTQDGNGSRYHPHD